MPIYKPSELRSFLQERGLYPKKGLSQNFLIDGNIIRKIIAAAEVQPGDAVLEVGPGPGSLTQALLEAGARVLAVEKDDLLAEALERLQTPTRQLVVRAHDILTFAIDDELPLFMNEPSGQAKMIANLPYHLTTPILVRFVPMTTLFSSITVMVQHEVARRMTAAPKTPDYGSLTLFLRFYTEPHYDFTVSRQCFYPVPRVDSAVVTLKLRTPPLMGADEIAFFKLTRTAFSHRRKMLRAALKEFYPPHKTEKALEEINLNPQARPEDLSLEQFLILFAVLHREHGVQSAG